MRHQKISQSQRQRVGFIVGHGELENIQMATAITRLQEHYDVVKVPLPLDKQIRDGLDAIVVAKPDTAFSEEDKYKIDQFIMKGGKALFFVDVVSLHMDSLIRNEGTFTFPIEHNLIDMFFKYGVRLNPNLIKDLNAGLIPIVVGRIADGRPNIQPTPWYYYPLINTFGEHPAVRNLGPVLTKFVSSIDTVKAPGIRKTPLLFTSVYSQIKPTPAFVRYEEMRPDPNQDAYIQGPLPVAYLLEGKFSSIYKSRSFSNLPGFIEQSKPTKILICSDGDLLRNEINYQKPEPEPVELGYDPFLNTTFANADFLMNVVSYMVDESGIVLAKNKEIVLRPLDKFKVQSQKTYWQSFNMGVPVVMVILFGLGFYFLRKRKYAKA
ncbi:MAG: gliding motility-associated ABC transporter substrate-binding protein GldG [Bacteroidia bacterium]|nr:gliding motility-associated ABC transporter substrate-binding protein GldG [Bacteroidia bacterium]